MRRVEVHIFRASHPRFVALRDGIGLTLDTQTKVRRQMQGSTLRGIELLTGLGGQVCVTCLQGAVRVEHPEGHRELLSRQQVTYRDASISAITDIDPGVQPAWRSGKLVFDRAPLAQAIMEINRYRRGRVLLFNAAAGREPVSGSFDPTLLDLALAQLQHTFGLRARALPAGIVVLS